MKSNKTLSFSKKMTIPKVFIVWLLPKEQRQIPHKFDKDILLMHWKNPWRKQTRKNKNERAKVISPLTIDNSVTFLTLSWQQPLRLVPKKVVTCFLRDHSLSLYTVYIYIGFVLHETILKSNLCVFLGRQGYGGRDAGIHRHTENQCQLFVRKANTKRVLHL